MMANGNYRPPPQYGCVVGAFIMLLALVVLVLRALHTLHHPAYLGH